MVAKKTFNPIWKEVFLPLGLALIVALSTWLTYNQNVKVQGQGVVLEKKIDEVHELANSNLTTVQRKLDGALEYIKYLKDRAEARGDTSNSKE